MTSAKGKPHPPPRSIGIVFYVKNKLAMELTDSTAYWLTAQGIDVLLEEECGRELEGRHPTAPMTELVRQVDVVIAIGGDGTLLHAARHSSVSNTPVLGINRGTVGFLAELSPGQVETGLAQLLRGDYRIEMRMMLDVRVLRRGEQVMHHLALNDCVVKREISRILRYDLALNGKYLDTFPADGVIVATPTGSTAYSLSAGGPVVKPDLDVLLICPICAHRFYGRSLLVNASDTVEITFRKHSATDIGGPETETTKLTVDGQTTRTLGAEDVVEVRRSRHYTHLVRLTDTDFFQLLREKLS